MVVLFVPTLSFEVTALAESKETAIDSKTQLPLLVLLLKTQCVNPLSFFVFSFAGNPVVLPSVPTLLYHPKHDSCTEELWQRFSFIISINITRTTPVEVLA